VTYELDFYMDSEDFASLLRSLVGVSHYCGMVQMWPVSAYGEKVGRLLNDLSKQLVRTENTFDWPGTKSLQTDAPVRYLFSVSDLTVDKIIACGTEFDSWIAPKLLDDIHFLRSDGSTVLGSTSSEQWVWLDVTAQELEHITKYMSPAQVPYARPALE
jgi:hypothetical protein